MNNLIRKQLLCRFSNNKQYLNEVDQIKNNFNLVDKKIFILSNEKNSNEVYLTFNIQKNNVGIQKKYPNTISIHRKIETNTLYTLNAMNRLIEDENDGVFDKSYKLDWHLYQDCIILTNNPGVKIIPVKLLSTIKF